MKKTNELQGALLSRFPLYRGWPVTLLLGLSLLMPGGWLHPVSALSEQLTPGTLDRQFEKRAEPRSSDKIILPRPALQQPPDLDGEYRFTLNSLSLEGGSVYSEEEMAGYYRQFLGQEISAKTLFTIAGSITSRYADDGYALSLAYVPAQEIDREGRVRLIIVEGYIGEVRYRGDVERLSHRAKRQIERIMAEHPLTVATLERQLLLANDVPGITFITTIDRSALDVGAAGLVVEITAKNLGYALGVNNRGSRAQGPWRVNFGVNFNNILFEDSSIGFQGQRALHGEEMQFYALHYGLVLTDTGLGLDLQANVSKSEPDVDILQLLEYDSRSENYSAALHYPLIRSRRRNLDLSLKLDIKHSEGQFFGETNADEKTRVLRLGTIYDWIDSTGATNLVQATLSQGLDILNATDNDSVLKVRDDADYHFTALRIDGSRNQRLTKRISLFATTTLQYASDPLAPSEQCGWGGELAGRGYDSFELSGDYGLLGGLELRQTWQSPLVRVNYLQPYIYLEGAKLWTKVNGASGGGTDTVWGFDYGIGVRGQVQDEHYIYMELAKPGRQDVSQIGNQDVRFFVGWQMVY